MEPKVTFYAGLLDQSGFKQWYKYQKLRAAHRYDAVDVSFLMSKPSFYFRDYEMMECRRKEYPHGVIRDFFDFQNLPQYRDALHWWHIVAIDFTNADDSRGSNYVYNLQKHLMKVIEAAH